MLVYFFTNHVIHMHKTQNTHPKFLFLFLLLLLTILFTLQLVHILLLLWL